LTTKWAALSTTLPKGTPFQENTSYTTYKSLTSVLLFVQLTLLPNPQNPMLYNVFQSVKHPEKCPFPKGVCTHTHIVPWTNVTQHPKMHLDQLGRFGIAYGGESLYFTMSRNFPSSKLPHCTGHLDLHVTHGSVGPPSQHLRRHHDWFCRIAGFTVVTDRQTD